MTAGLVSVPVATLQHMHCASRHRIRSLGSAPVARLLPSTALRYRQQRQSDVRSRQVTTMGLFGLGFPELAIVGGVAVLLFGPSKLPGLGKELGKTVKSFQGAAKEFEAELKNATDKDIFDEEDGLNPKPKLPQEEQKK